MLSCTTATNLISTSSPPEWPNRSLSDLKWSRSRNSRQSGCALHGMTLHQPRAARHEGAPVERAGQRIGLRLDALIELETLLRHRHDQHGQQERVEEHDQVERADRAGLHRQRAERKRQHVDQRNAEQRRTAQSVANSTITGQRDGKRFGAAAPELDRASGPAAMRDQARTARRGTATFSMKPGIRQAASHSAGRRADAAARSAAAGRTRAPPCQQQTKATIRTALPIADGEISPRRSRASRTAPSAALARSKRHAPPADTRAHSRCLYQNTRNSPPSTSLMNSPNSSTVKESICMSGLPGAASRIAPPV